MAEPVIPAIRQPVDLESTIKAVKQLKDIFENPEKLRAIIDALPPSKAST